MSPTGAQYSPIAERQILLRHDRVRSFMDNHGMQPVSIEWTPSPLVLTDFRGGICPWHKPDKNWIPRSTGKAF